MIAFCLSSVAAQPALARRNTGVALTSELTDFAAARAASLTGDHGDAARRYAELVALNPANQMFARSAIGESLRAGDVAQAYRIASTRPVGELTADARLLLVAEALKRGDSARAIEVIRVKDGEIDLSFLEPLVSAWIQAARNDPAALTTLDRIPAQSAAAALANEARALILLKLGRGAEADPFARRAVAAGGGREDRIRLAMAQGFTRLHDMARAQDMLGGTDPLLVRARAELAAGRLTEGAVDTPSRGFAQILAALSLDLNNADSRNLALSLAQAARFADPDDSELILLAGLLLDADGQVPSALKLYASIPPSDLFAGEARDASVRALIRTDRSKDALAIALPATRMAGATADDWSRLGDVYSAMELNGAAADAYGRAVALVAAGGPGASEWQLRLLQGSALDQAGQWPAGKATLERGLQLAPNQPLLLNYLGYAELEKGRDFGQAMDLIRRASALAPQDASITDSLGWAQFKRGRVTEAIDTLEKAAAADPTQAELREHLGDALYTAGRHFEARYAWSAALATADAKETARLHAKLDAGLNSSNAAP